MLSQYGIPSTGDRLTLEYVALRGSGDTGRIQWSLALALDTCGSITLTIAMLITFALRLLHLLQRHLTCALAGTSATRLQRPKLPMRSTSTSPSPSYRWLPLRLTSLALKHICFLMMTTAWYSSGMTWTACTLSLYQRGSRSPASGTCGTRSWISTLQEIQMMMWLVLIVRLHTWMNMTWGLCEARYWAVSQCATGSKRSRLALPPAGQL